MARTYTLKRRAEKQAQTRRRIVEAAVDLHGSIGPAATTVSLLAERAGVQRHTVYAHFPDERSLQMACSALHFERDPMPDPEPWRAMADLDARRCVGLAALYDWYARNAELAGCVLRDAEHHTLTREIAELRMGPYFADYSSALGDGLDAGGRAMLQLAYSFFTWRSLRDQGLEPEAAAEMMANAVRDARSGS